ncbi:MAG: hypothetical protein B9S32_11940 [Verrucomicrobia bacterium Tous-C9LFEB]|nr:MAG: hypothetical protein B9S32_11940 [Verrucomicrobia bacterium Tous-C9LFEB]
MSEIKFAVVLSIGPGEAEIPRAQDLIESLNRYEPRAVQALIVIEDAVPSRDLSHALPPLKGGETIILPNPRQGRGDGIQGGLSSGILTGFSCAATLTNVDFAIKLDTDSLVIAPFADRIQDSFLRHPEIAMWGCFRKSPVRVHDLPEDFPTAPALRKHLRVFTLWRLLESPWLRLQCILRRRDRIRRELILKSLKNGLILGQHCQGGGYAIRQEMLQTLHQQGAFSDLLLWNETSCSEDVVMTLTVAAFGGQPGDLNDDGDPFGVVYRGLADAPQRLVERGFGIIHSVKDFESFEEKAIRAFFRQRRQATDAT